MRRRGAGVLPRGVNFVRSGRPGNGQRPSGPLRFWSQDTLTQQKDCPITSRYANGGACNPAIIWPGRGRLDRVPLEYSIEWLTCAIGGRPGAVMAGWPVLLKMRRQIGRFCVFYPGGLSRLGGLRRRGTPHAVLSPGQARRVGDRRAVDLTRLAGVWDVASRRSFGSQRLGYDRSASEAHASGRMPDAATQSSARNTPSRWFSSPSDVTGLVHRPIG
jgi:hypothetical protein